MRQYYKSDTRQNRSDTRQNMRSNMDAIENVREENTNPDKKKPETERSIKDIIKVFLGKNITVMLRGRKSLKGKLESVSNYEILVTADNLPVVIMKHAIDYVELTEETL